MGNSRTAVFSHIKSLMKKYEPPLVATHDSGSRYELWSKKDVVIAGRKRKDLFFASVVVQRDYVGFYFMPVYTDAGMKKLFGKELLSTLKGKSCFHITFLDPRLTRQLTKALAVGFALYRKNGWLA